MPRLRTVRTKEDAEKVPQDQPVQVEILDEEASLEAAGEVEDNKDKPPAKKEARAEPPPDEESAPEDESAGLRKQIEALTKAEQAAKNQLIEAQRREQELRNQANNANQERDRHREQADEARYVAIMNALNAAESEQAQAQQMLEQAMETGNFKLQAEASSKLARAAANISKHEDAKALYEADKEQRPQRQEQPQQQQNGLPDSAQQWLRAHPEYMSDPRKNAKISALHWDVMDEGHTAFSPGYFESLEMHLGLRERPKKEPEIEIEDDPAPPPARRTVVTAAPPTRDAPSPSGGGNKANQRVTLTEEERAIARGSGISDIEYAKQKIRLADLKKNGHYQER